MINTAGSLPIPAQVTLYVLLFFMGLYSVLVFFWQILVLRGRSMKNPDGSLDDWKEQKNFWGIAIADVFLACPVVFFGIGTALAGIRWGFFLLALVGFWFLWANLMTTANSLRFEKPKITFNWFITFPAGFFVGAAYISWIVVHFDEVFGI
jgi:hypothetical protein